MPADDTSSQFTDLSVSPPRATLNDCAIEPAVFSRLPREFVETHLAVPYAIDGDVLQVAVPQAGDVVLADALRYVTGGAVRLVEAPIEDLQRAIRRGYRLQISSSQGEREVPPAYESAKGIPQDEPPDEPIIQLANELITEAIQRRASDIHVEPLAGYCRVRYRVDGALVEAARLSLQQHRPLVSRLKIMADMSIAEKRQPQDGRLTMTTAGKQVDLRVSSMPTTHGESIVMRLLDPTIGQRDLSDLGLESADQATLEQALDAADGLVLVTGPTGSGKTTTLYSCLRQLNRRSNKIITIEDPIEYRLSGINQVAVKSDIGMTFAAGLRAMLRQSPDAIMVGEIRDRETAEIAIQASLTGHQVLSTLHTNDAAAAISRLLDMGAKSFLVAASLRAVVAQRLVRRLCVACSREVYPGASECAMLGLSEASPAKIRQAVGCVHCAGTGYQGQIGIFEIFLVTGECQRLIHEQASVGRLRAWTRGQARSNLRDDGVRKVLAGLTTIHEVMSATVGDEL